MLKNQDIAALLIKHNNQETTQEEEKVLQDWRFECKENEDCYNRLTDMEYVLTEAAQYMYNKPDVGLAHYEVMQRINEQRKTRRDFFIWGAVAAAVIIGVLLLPIGKEKATSETPPVAKKTFTPPTSAPFGKALLVLADEAIALDTVKDGLIRAYGNVRIEKENQAISYRSMGNSPTGGSVYSKLITGPACQLQVILPDSSTVVLGPSSWLRADIVPNARERRAEMGGRAYFTVTHDTRKPFSLTVNNAVNNAGIRVLGTEFNVDAYDKGGIIKTLLVKGSVALTGEGAKITLLPGEMATLVPGQPVKKEDSNLDRETGWKKGDFVFKADNITTVMNELSRWYDIEVIYSGPLPTASITSILTRTNDLDKILDALNKLPGVRLTRDPVNKRRVIVSEPKD
jgi:ferric-dicitrate binding protein FerR (iron transport regulator)